MTQEQREEIAQLKQTLEYTNKILDKKQYRVIEQEINRKMASLNSSAD